MTKHGTNKGAGVTWPTRRIQANHHPDTTTTVIRATVATIAGDGGIASRMDSDNLEWMHNEDDEIDDETVPTISNRASQLSFQSYIS